MEYADHVENRMEVTSEFDEIIERARRAQIEFLAGRSEQEDQRRRFLGFWLMEHDCRDRWERAYDEWQNRHPGYHFWPQAEFDELWDDVFCTDDAPEYGEEDPIAADARREWKNFFQDDTEWPGKS